MEHGAGDHGPGFADVFAGVALGHAFSEHGFAHNTFADVGAEAAFVSWALDPVGSGHLGGRPGRRAYRLSTRPFNRAFPTGRGRLACQGSRVTQQPIQ